ncbi:MAG: hypothetical protein WCO25_04525 [Candidatus Uhrbacteria bacterium]
MIAIPFLLSLQLTRPWDHPRDDLVATMFATSGFSLGPVSTDPPAPPPRTVYDRGPPAPLPIVIDPRN